MCGILGANFTSKYDFLEATNIMKNRGPDNTSIKTIQNKSSISYFGHTRLKIIDLDDSSNQPMIFDNILIVFNGEIYNYKELIIDENLTCETKSDTEVILRLYQKYDIKFLDKLNGQFSFCIYDIKKNKYFLARDRYSKKPLYYYHKDDKFIFSSMITPIIKLLGYTPKLNKIALSQYLQYFTPLTPNTFYTDIYKLDSSTYMIYENNKLSTKKYYQISTKKIITNKDIALEKIEDELFKSIKKRLVCDVEVGSLLSGGIDSSLISSIYSRLSKKKIHTFSIGYQEHKKYSELPYSNIVSKYIKSEHTQIELSKDDYINSIEYIQESMEEPHADPAAIPLFHLTKEINRQGIKTVLSGEGADELFLGYEAYAKYLEYYNFKKSLSTEQELFIKNNILKSLSTNTKEANYFKKIFNKSTIYNGFGEIFNQSQKSKLFKKVPSFSFEKEKKDPIDWMSYIDMKIWLGEVLLSKVDKISMSNSIEVRNPFLDHNIVNLAFSIDSKLKVGDTNKHLLKKVAKNYIPKEIINRKKKGFNSPYNEWLQEEYQDNLLNTILIANQHHNLFNNSYIKEIYNQSKQNKQKQHIYALWTFSKWYIKTYL